MRDLLPETVVAAVTWLLLEFTSDVVSAFWSGVL